MERSPVAQETEKHQQVVSESCSEPRAIRTNTLVRVSEKTTRAGSYCQRLSYVK